MVFRNNVHHLHGIVFDVIRELIAQPAKPQRQSALGRRTGKPNLVNKKAITI